MPLGPGVFREGEVADPEALGQAIKELFARERLRREVRVGIANQRVAVRSMRLPAIDNRDELETAIRFQAQDHIPMPLDQAVLDWQVVGHTTDENGERKVDVVAVAARRDMIAQVLKALSIAGLRPIGIDHSAFGMIRALAREVGSPVGPGQFVSAPAYEERAAAHASGEQGVVLTENHAPAKLFCNLGDVTNLAVARGSSCLFTRIASFGIEGIAQKLAERRRLTVEHSRQWLIHVGLEQPVEAIEGDPEHMAPRANAWPTGPPASRTSSVSRWTTTRPRRRRRDRGHRRLRSGNPDPRLVERLQRSLGPRLQRCHADPLGAPRRGLRRASDPVVRTGVGGVADAPRKLIPPEDRRGDRAPLRAGRFPTSSSAPWRSCSLAVTLMVTTSNDIADKEAQVDSSRPNSRRRRPRLSGLAPFAEFARSHRARGDDREPRPEPLRLGARDARAGPGHPEDVTLTNLNGSAVDERRRERVDERDRRAQPHDQGLRGLARGGRWVRRGAGGHRRRHPRRRWPRRGFERRGRGAVSGGDPRSAAGQHL